ncbi:MAG: MATE family efflux transporter [Spirochaetales bacterium]|nr:MATE family efflux transporter [Spirochaetales bacterium]MCF7939474.1 MATE family efflux transporter [Spirochaetales bacterium]
MPNKSRARGQGARQTARQLDITGGHIPRLLIRMAAPASVGFLFNTLYNVIDTYWGGQFSTDVLASLSLSFPVFLILLSAGMGIASGTSALIANALGGGSRERAYLYQGQAIGLSVAVAAVLIVPMILSLRSIFTFMGAEPALLDTAFRYSSILVGGSVFFIINAVFNASLTARGDTKTYRNFLILGFLLNIGLDPLLMFGLDIGGFTLIPPMREAGIALATILIQAVGSVYLGRKMIQAGGLGPGPDTASSPAADTAAPAPSRLGLLRPRLEYWREIGGQGAPAALNMAAMALGTFVITSFVARFGTSAVAAYGAALRIEQIALIPTIGLNIALATMVGQNNGAGRLDRVRQSYRTSLLFGLILMAFILTPVLLFGRSLIGLFTSDSRIISIGLRYLYIQGITFYSYVLMNQSNSIMQGLKRPGMIMWIGLYRQIAAPFLVFSLLTTAAGLGVDGVWWGLVIVNWTAALFTLWWSRRLLRIAEERSPLFSARPPDHARPPLSSRAAAPGGLPAGFPCIAAEGCREEEEV